MPERSKLILLADDDPEDLELLQEALLQSEPGLKIHLADSGKKVIDFLTKSPDNDLPSLIVLDYNMPDVKGPEVLAKLHKETRYRGIPKIVWSTSNNNHYIRECMENGAATYFVKPSTTKELQQQAKEMLGFSNALFS